MTLAAAAPIAFGARWGKRLAVTLGALALYRLGLQIPLPGLSADAVSGVAAHDGEVPWRLSVFALGVRPLFEILFLFEIACLAFPPLRRAAANHDRGFERGLLLCAAALAAFRGVVLAFALEARPDFVEEPGVGFVVGIVATFVGATALMIWLCGRVQIAGIGDGFWVLLAAPIVASFNADARNLAAFARTGALSSGALAADLTFVALAVAALVAARLARTPSPAPSADRRAQLPEILWPPILAYYLAAALPGLLSLAASSGAQTRLSLARQFWRTAAARRGGVDDSRLHGDAAQHEQQSGVDDGAGADLRLRRRRMDRPRHRPHVQSRRRANSHRRDAGDQSSDADPGGVGVLSRGHGPAPASHNFHIAAPECGDIQQRSAVMASPKGKFVWYEYMGDDLHGAADFYSGVVGWSVRDSGMPGFDYRIVSAGPAMVAGMMAAPDEARKMGARPSWIGYVWRRGRRRGAAGAARGGRPGSTRSRPTFPASAASRWSAIPTAPPSCCSATRGAIRRRRPRRRRRASSAGANCTPATASAPSRSIPACSAGRRSATSTWGRWASITSSTARPAKSGGMMTRSPQTPASFWLYYFNVEAIDAAVARVNKAGGKIANGPMEVPTGQWVAQAFDPQGAMFALVAPKR